MAGALEYLLLRLFLLTAFTSLPCCLVSLPSKVTISNFEYPHMTLTKTLADLYKANGKEVIILPPTLAHGSIHIYQIDRGPSDADDEDEDQDRTSLSTAQIKL